MHDSAEPVEVDNCPRCNRTVVLEHGFATGAYEVESLVEAVEEIEYGTCKTCGTRFRRREEFNRKKGYPFAIYEEWASLVPELDIKGLKVGPFLSRWWKLKEKRIPVDLLRT